MIDYAIIDSTGLVIGVGQAQNAFEAGVSGSESGTVVIVPAGVSPKPGISQYNDGVFADIPPPPHDWLVWDGTAWVDPRDPAQIAVDLYQARYQTNTDKRLVFYRLATIGAYPVSELVDDTTYFPATVEEYLNSLDPGEHDTVKAALKYEPLIWRLHPYLIGDVGVQGFIPWLAAENAVTITEAQLDTIFDVPVPPPLYTP